MSDTVCKGMGVSRRSLQQIYTNWSEKGFELKRKVNENKGKTVFNCEQRREQTFTAFNIYKHKRARHHRDSPDCLSVDELKNDFVLLSDEEREAYKDIVKPHHS
eukprot:3237450-Ditylum_brightwellii.AAC.1